jgi:hypothetical protein
VPPSLIREYEGIKIELRKQPVNHGHAARTATNNAANRYLQSNPPATLLAAPVNIVTWAPDFVALPPIPSHIRDPTPPPLAAVSVASGVSVDPSTTSTDEDAARLYVVPSTVTAGAPGVMVVPATTRGARLVTGASVLVEEPTTRSGAEDARLYFVPPMVTAGPPGVMVVPEMTIGAGGAGAALVEAGCGVWAARGVVDGTEFGFVIGVAGLFWAGVDCLLVELEVACE